MINEFSLHWFRQDLRLSDNPSLNYLSQKHKRIVCVFIYDEINCNRKLGSASKTWLHHSLLYLNNKLNNNLLIFKGNPESIFLDLIKQNKITEISWNRCYEPWRVERDKLLKKTLTKHVGVKTFNGSLLWEPWEVLKADSTPYKIFTPFYQRGCLTKNLLENQSLII